jgi:putative membrane protein
MKLILKWLLLSAALMLVSQWDSGVVVQNYGAAMIAAMVLGLLNAVVRPLLIILTLPVTLLSMGLFLFVINALTFQMASYLLDGFHVAGFGAALLGSILYSLWGLVIDVALERLFVRHQGPWPPQ